MRHFKIKKWAVTASAVSLMIFGAPLAAEAASINLENYNYTGSATTYSTLADAQNGTSSLGTYSIETRLNGTNSTLPNARDAYIYADTATNDFTFGTGWYFTPQEHFGGAGGTGNPNNSNNGFIQLYDYGSGGASVSALSMGWDPTFTQFSINASGANAGATEYARFWPAPDAGGAGSISSGTFVEYDYALTATFSAASPSGVLTGVTPDSVTGAFSAIFQNTGTDLLYNNFYVIDLLFHTGSSAELYNYANEGYAGYTSFDQTIADTAFIAPVPLPAALPLFAGGLGLMGLLGWRRKRKLVA